MEMFDWDPKILGKKEQTQVEKVNNLGLVLLSSKKSFFHFSFKINKIKDRANE